MEKEQWGIELIDLVSDKLKQIQTNTKKTEDQFEKTGTEVKRFGNSIGKDLSGELKRSIGQFAGMAAAVLAVKKVITATTGAVFSFSGASAKLKAIVRPTTAEFVNLEKAALKLGSTTAFTASQVMDAFTEQAKLGQKVNEILASGNSILNLAAMSQIGLAEAAEMTVQTLNQFDMSAEETNRVVNVMAKSFTSSALDARKFGEAFKFAGAIGSETGEQIESVTALMAVLADRSIEAGMAGRSSRQILLRLADSSSVVSKALKKAGSSASTVEEKFRDLNKMNLGITETTKMFGMEAVTAAQILIKNADDVARLGKEYRDTNNDAEQMAETMLDSLPGAAVKMKSALEGLALSLKNVVTPTLTTFMTVITKTAQGFTRLISGQKNLEKMSVANLYTEQAKQIQKLNDLQKDNGKVIKQNVSAYQEMMGVSSSTLINNDKEIIKTKEYIEVLKQKIAAQNLSNSDVGATNISLGGSKSIVNKKISVKSSTVDISETEKRIKQQKKLADSIQQIQRETILQSLDGKEKEAQALDNWYLSQQEKFKGNNEHLATLKTEFEERKIMIFASYAEQEAEKEKELIDKKKLWLEGLAEKNREVLERRAADEEQFRTDMTAASIDSGRTLVNAMFTIGKNRTNYEKRQSIERIRNSTRSEKEKEAAIETIEKEAFEKNKKRMISQAIMNGALGVTKTLATVAFPKSIPVLIMQGAMVAANIATIASQKFAKGGVVQQEAGLPSTGDQHLVRVNPGETIRTPEQERALKSNINIGDTNIVINGNIDQGTLGQIDSLLKDRNEEIRDSLLQLQDSGRISGVTF